jgi:hypothetical protein
MLFIQKLDPAGVYVLAGVGAAATGSEVNRSTRRASSSTIVEDIAMKQYPRKVLENEGGDWLVSNPYKMSSLTLL